MYVTVYGVVWCSSREHLYPPQGKLDHVYFGYSRANTSADYLSRASQQSTAILIYSQSVVCQYIG